VKTRLYPPFKASTTISIASWKRPLATDLPEAPIQYFMAGDQGKLAYRTSGSPQDQPIVWIHGLPLDSRSWVAQYDSFSEGFYNVFLDLRGYGDSTKLPKNVSDVTQVYCNDLAALIDHLNLPAATLVGFASAGHVALRFSGQNPQRVKSLVLLNGSPCFKRQGPDYTWGFTDEQINNHFLSPARADGLQSLLSQVLDPSVVFQELGSDDAETISSWFRVMAEKAGLDTLLGFFEHMVNDDDRHLIPSITAPTLILSSSMGKEVPAQTACYLRGRISNSKLVEIPDADHFFHVTRPVFVNEAIRSFLSTI
jgi:pimeloyl-ACP methyl ester carboxylesterase